MNERIKRLRKQSLSIKPYLSQERAKLVTEFYKSDEVKKFSIPVQRALAFKYILERKTLCINEGELIVGERGPGGQEANLGFYGLRILDTRKKTSFSVDEKTKKLYKEELIPFWRGKSIRDRIFNEMSKGWKAAFEAGV